MAYTNTGDYRYQYVEIIKIVDGVVDNVNIYSITDNPNFHYGGGEVTETALARLPEGDEAQAGTYLNLLFHFKAYVEAIYTGLDIDAVQTNTPYGTNATWCVIAIDI